MTSTHLRLASPARWGSLALLLAALLASPPAAARRVEKTVARALGGKARGSFKPAERTTLRRPMRRPPAVTPGPGAMMTLPVGNTRVSYLDAAHYGAVRTAALELMRRNPPAKSFYVAIGRSPVAIAAFLGELNPDMVMTFPASDMRRSIKPEWKESYFEFFRELIPEDVLSSGRNIVLFDRARAGSGKSLNLLKGYLEEYIAATVTVPEARARVRAVGLAPSGPLIGDVELIDTSALPGLFLYRQGKAGWNWTRTSRRSPARAE